MDKNIKFFVILINSFFSLELFLLRGAEFAYHPYPNHYNENITYKNFIYVEPTALMIRRES